MKLNDKIDYLQDGKSIVSLVDRMMVDSPLKVVNSARISYSKKKDVFDEKDTKLCRFLDEEDHTSPFRHSYFTFHIKAPLFVYNQLKKYQVGSTFRSYEVDGNEVSLEVFDHYYDTDKGCSWNEISGRYTQTSKEFYVPKELRSNPPHGNKQSSGKYENPLHHSNPEKMYEDEILNEMKQICNDSLFLYDRFIKNGVAKEIARAYLPQGMYSEAYWTISLQGVIHFLRQRLHKNAQYEIRMLAEGIYNLLKTDLDKLGIQKQDLTGE